MQGSLSRLAAWELDRKQDDIRGWSLRDADGKKLGTVGDLVIDTDTEHVTEVVLSDGRQFPAHDVWVGDHTLTLEGVLTDTGRPLVSPPRAREPAAETEKVKPASPGIKEKIEAKIEQLEEKTEKLRGATEKLEEKKDEVVARMKGTGPAAAADERPIPRAEALEPRAAESTADLDLVVPIIEEVLEVGTRPVSSGSMRVTSRIVTEPVDDEVLLREESVLVERLPVDRPLTNVEAEKRLHGTTLEMQARSEVPLVEKRAHVVEEVLLHKDVNTREHVVRETVRRTEADVTKVDGTKATNGANKGDRR